MEQTRRQQLESHLADRPLQDPEFRERLLANTKQAIEAEIGLRFPEMLSVVVHEEKLTELHVVLPVDLVTSESLAPPVMEEGHRPFWKRMLRRATE